MTHPVCVCSAHQNVVLLVDAIYWNLTYLGSNKCIMHRCEFFPGSATLREFLDQELNAHEDDEKFNYSQWDTTYRAISSTFTAPYEEFKETLIDVVDEKLKITSFLIQHEI